MTTRAEPRSRADDFACFYRVEMPRLLRFLAIMGAEPADAADAAQQAFVEVWRRWERVGGMASPAGYVRRAATNEWVRQNRRRSEDVARAIGGNWLDLIAVEDVYGRTEVKAVLQCLAELPGHQREVMAWLYDGYTPGEIAAQLGMKPSTVRSTVRHAKEKLRSLGIGREEVS